MKKFSVEQIIGVLKQPEIGVTVCTGMWPAECRRAVWIFPPVVVSFGVKCGCQNCPPSIFSSFI